MCGGCPEFIKRKSKVIEAAAALQSSILVSQLNEYEDLCQSAYLKILDVKSNNPDIIHKPNAYLHTLVKNLSIDGWRNSQRYSPLESHEEIVKNHVTERIEDNPERLVEIRKLYQFAKSVAERRALLSIANDESLEDYALDTGQPKAHAAVNRMRLIQKISKRINSGDR